jgi:hypothetical protein
MAISLFGTAVLIKRLFLWWQEIFDYYNFFLRCELKIDTSESKIRIELPLMR